MACCLTALIQYLNQWWLIVDWTVRKVDEIWIKILLSSKKMNFKISSAEWWPFCLGFIHCVNATVSRIAISNPLWPTNTDCMAESLAFHKLLIFFRNFQQWSDFPHEHSEIWWSVYKKPNTDYLKKNHIASPVYDKGDEQLLTFNNVNPQVYGTSLREYIYIYIYELLSIV